MKENRETTTLAELQLSHITLTRLRFHAYHGVLDQERIVGNDYTVDLCISADLSQAMDSDDVADTINYAEVYQKVKEEMGKNCHLIERVARNIADRLIEDFETIESVEVHVTKHNPPMSADGCNASVRAIFSRK